MPDGKNRVLPKGDNQWLYAFFLANLLQQCFSLPVCSLPVFA